MSKAPLYRTKTTHIIYASLEDNAKYNPPQQSKRLRDSILLSVFSSHIFARYKNEALWI